MATTPDYTILHAPRMTSAGFAAVLRAASSPAAPEAAACYKVFVEHGVDPAVGLAVFRKESTYGRFGRANANRSWGNLRGGRTYPLDSGGFRRYPTWLAGAADAARLLAIYGHNQIRPGTNTSTVQTFPYVWAPAADGNAPDTYGDQLAAWIGQWSRSYPVGVRWWPTYLDPPPAGATFAIAVPPGTYWQVSSSGAHLVSIKTGGFSAYGRNRSLVGGRYIGELMTGAYAGRWFPLSIGKVTLRP